MDGGVLTMAASAIEELPGRWPDCAARRVASILDVSRGSFFESGLLATVRTDYRERPLPPEFRLEVLQVEGAWRRVAIFEGCGRPLLIVPGMYASLHEGLFVKIAELAAHEGRTVWLVEDRLAGQTLRINGGTFPSLARQADELAAIVRQLGDRPDVLAFSTGSAAALASAAAPFERLVAWSPAIDPRGVFENVVRRLPLRLYFRRLHRRAFRAAAMRPPPMAELADALLGDGFAHRSVVPLLAVHASDDPVVPVSCVRRLELGPQQELLVLPRGGHLGFETRAPLGIYLLPLGLGPGERAWN
jgi:pimeloyl-ACP methyl ester carboxylesterase